MSGTFLRVLGAVLIVLGVFWALQGAGVVGWPAASPMLGAPRWTWIGLGVAILGLALLALGRRRA